MRCSSCSHQNRPAAKFCEQCGTALRPKCAGCGSEVRPAARFCDECGTPTSAGAPPRPPADRGARKIVSIVFADLVGSTALHERLDPESARRFMESYYAAMRGAVEDHGGTVTQLLGDGVKAVFGIPRVAEDDALRAVRAAVTMQDSFRELAERQRGAVGRTGLRVAVNTGEVVAEDDTEIIGDPVNVAARLQEQGRDGDVVIGQATHRLVESELTTERLGSFALKGRAEEVEAYRVVSLDPPSAGTVATFVGRDDELERVTAVFREAASTPATRMAVVLGSAGIGKSRLMAEFARRRGEAATVLEAHCDAAGGSTFAPLANAIRRRLGIASDASWDDTRGAIESALPDGDERDRIASGVVALLEAAPSNPEETFFAVRRLLAALVSERPGVLVIDDLQWAEPLFLDLVEHLVQWGDGVPLLVLIGARPELREVRASLATAGPLVSDVVTLAGLDAGAATKLAAAAIGMSDLPAAVAAKVLATSEGNPLFVSELVRMLVHEGALVRDGDRWTVARALDVVEMPPTIQAVLAARIERLEPEERSILECASVVGRHFSRGAVGELLSAGREDIDDRLESLQRAELIERDRGWVLGEPALRFHHVLIRDAAYRRLLKRRRAELHERLADWIESRWGDSDDYDETLGRHLEQAHQMMGELGPSDECNRSLGARAATRLAAAGRRALEGDDPSRAAALLGRALHCLETDATDRAELALDWCESLLSAGDVARARGALEELERCTGDSARLAAWQTCFAGQLTVLTASEQLEEMVAHVSEATESLSSLGDAAGEAKGHYVKALALGRLGRVGACEVSLDQSLAAARTAGDRRRASSVLAIAPVAALWGPSPVMRASGRCLDVVRVLRITRGAPAVEAVALGCQGVLEALRGRPDAARQMLASARRMVEELGVTQRVVEVDALAGQVALLEDDAAGAERALRGAYGGFRDLGHGIDAARAAALLARAVLAQGRVDEAVALSHESEALAGDDLKAAISWRGVRAEALARGGETVAAIELARQAVEIAAATDALLDHADARRALAIALRAAGRTTDAEQEKSRASELWHAKGASIFAEGAERPTTAAEASLRRRLRPNLADAPRERRRQALADRDWPGIRALLADGYQAVDHAAGTAYGADELVESLRLLYQGEDPGYAVEVLATLGPHLSLVREHHGARALADGRFHVAEFAHETIRLSEVGDDGRYERSESFPVDRLGDAVVRMYERYGERAANGPERERALGAARSIRSFSGALGIDGLRERTARDCQVVDHRVLGTWSGDRRAVGDHLRGLEQLASDVRVRDEDVLGLGPGVLLRRHRHLGTQRFGGGSYERAFLMLATFDADGRFSRIELFDLDRESDALARFDALDGERSAASRFSNGASRWIEEALVRRWTARDWEGLAATFAPGFRYDDRRAISRSEAGVEDFLAGSRVLWDQPSGGFELELVATRGERLAASCVQFHPELADGAPLETPGGYAVYEVDEGGRATGFVLFDRDDEAGARAELDARYGDTEGQGLDLIRRINERDWESALAHCADDMLQVDHRRVALLGTTRGAGAWIENLRALVALAPDVEVTLHHVRATPRGSWSHCAWTGSRDGGRFEIPMIIVREYDETGRTRRFDAYDEDDHDAAVARLAEIVGPEDSSPPFANEAWRAFRAAFGEAWVQRDEARFVAAHAPSLRVRDHRRLLRTELTDRDAFVEYARPMLEAALEESSCLLATRGEHLALAQFTVVFGSEPAAESATDSLGLIEVDENGSIIAYDRYDPDDFETAFAELEARWAAQTRDPHTQIVTEMVEGLRRGEWNRLEELATPGFHAVDHRRLGWGDTLRDLPTWIESQRALRELSPDAFYRIDHYRVRQGVALYHATQQGTRAGGEFENRFLGLATFDERGRTTRLEIYDVDRFSEAYARLEELGQRGTGEPDRFANAATRGLQQLRALGFDRYAETFSPDFRYVDRRSLARVESGRDEYVAATRAMWKMTVHLSRHTLATRGDRWALARILWRGEDEDVGPSELEWLSVLGVDDEGRRVAQISFDVDDLGTALEELESRFLDDEADGPNCGPARTSQALQAGINARDWEAVWRLHAPDVVGHDHRLVSWGRLDGEEYMRSMQSMVAMADDVRLAVDHVRVSGRVHLADCRWSGTREGGAFESPFLAVSKFDAEARIAEMHLFDPKQVDRARACFEGLVAGRSEDARDGDVAAPSAASERFANAASRRWHRALDAWLERDGSFEAFFAPSFEGHDRRRLVRVDMDREEVLAYSRPMLETSLRQSSRLLATRGERHAALRTLVEFGEDPRNPSSIDSIVLVEVDADQTLTWWCRYDVEDAADALEALEDRFVEASAGLDAQLASACRDVLRAINGRDFGATKAFYAPAMEGHDHRLASWGTLRGDEYFRSIEAMIDLAPDVRVVADHVRIGARGILIDARWVGTREGGRFESAFVMVSEVDDEGRTIRSDLFEPEHLDRAWARFEEISAAAPNPLREIAGRNGAVRAFRAVTDAFRTRDLEAMRARFAPNMVWEDRRPYSQVKGDAELAVASLRTRIEQGASPTRLDVVGAAGDRIGVVRLLWTGESEGGAFEMEGLEVGEVDGQGRLVRVVGLEADDWRDAQRIAWERWGAREPDFAPVLDVASRYNDALNAPHLDLARLRSFYTDDFVAEDRRRTGFGRIEGADAYLESLGALATLTRSMRIELGWHWAAIEPDGGVVSVRRTGELGEGGAYETEHWVVFCLDGTGLTRRMGSFELEHLDEALSCFDEWRSR